MLKRIMTSLVAFPILAAFVIYGGAPLQLALFLMAIIGMHEMYMAISKRILPIHYAGYIFAAIYYLLLSNLSSVTSIFYSESIAKYFSTYILIFSSLFVITLFMLVVCMHEKINIIDCAVTAMGFFYVAFLMSFIYLTRQYSYGQYFVWLIFIAAWGCDTGAYFVGVTMGKHKLTPKLSPKKTVEGAIGGVIGAALIALVFGFTVTRINNISREISLTLFCTVTASVGAVFAQFGDLAASAIKRYTGIKDYGKIIPGHGGVLDRFDSVLFTAPVVYGIMFVLINFFR